MKKRALTIASVAIITVASIGGYAFAQGTEQGLVNNQEQNFVRESIEQRNYTNHCWNNEDMLQTMKDNGFEDMAKWMAEGDFESMNKFMENISEEDYEKMIELMKENGYGNRGRMMNFIGREGMINMHNSMMGGGGNRFGGRNMMGRFQ